MEPREFVVVRDLVVVPIASRVEGAGSGVEVGWEFTLIFTVRDGQTAAVRGHISR